MLPLDHIKVIDLTRARSGPTCVRLLSQMGADVIQIEVPGTEENIMTGRHHYDYQNLHVNKRNLTLNLKTEAARQVLLRLVQRSDVLVENFRPDVKHRLKIDYDTLAEVNPRLVYASISGFGQTGPDRDRPGLDQIAQGMSGVMTVNGAPGGGPMRVGLPIADLSAGFMAAYGVAVALLERERSGRGQWVHTSLLQAMIHTMEFQAVRWLMADEVPQQVGNNHPIQAPTGVYQASDGRIIIQAAGQTMFTRLCNAIEAPELLADPRFANMRDRFTHRAVLDAEIDKRIGMRTMADWMRLLAEVGVPAGPILNVEQCFENEQVQTLPVRAMVHHPMLGDITLMGPGVNLARTPASIRTPAPEQGQHTAEILSEIGYSEAEVAALQQQGAV
ncbi:MAG TPA: CoA transferase [Chloroflexota bacterium]|nr:CoA transferase [Chloroflexota bacterium]